MEQRQHAYREGSAGGGRARARLLPHGEPQRPDGRPHAAQAGGGSPAKLAGTPRDPDNKDGPKVGDRAEDAKFLVFSIKDMGFVGRKPHGFYCLDRTDVRPLTHVALGELLDRLHAETLECIAQGKAFGEGRAGMEFAKLLEEHATGGSNDDLLT